MLHRRSAPLARRALGLDVIAALARSPAQRRFASSRDQRARGRALLVALALCPALGCTTLADDLRRAEAAFAEARYEDAEVWLDDLDASVARMPTPERARYYYIAGMSAYRIGKRAGARHALALCREELTNAPDALPASWSRNLTAALADLRTIGP